MSAIDIHENPTRWETWTELYTPGWKIQAAESVELTGSPVDRVGGAIVDEFAEDLRRLADA